MDSIDYSADCFNHKLPRKRRKNSKWKLLDGLFSRKKIALQSASVDNNDSSQSDPKYSLTSISTLPRSQDIEEVSNSANRSGPKFKSERTTTSSILFDLASENYPVQPLKASEESFLPLQSFPEMNYDKSTGPECTSPLLDVEIPTNRLDRFSIMFKEPLERSNYTVSSQPEEEQIDSPNLCDNSPLDFSWSLNETSQNMREYSSLHFEPQLSPLSQPPFIHENATSKIGQTNDNNNKQNCTTHSDTIRSIPDSQIHSLLTLDISNLFQEGEHENFFSTPIAMRPKSRNTSSSSECRIGTVSSPSTFGSGHNLSASTSFSSISPPLSATSTSNQNKQLNLQSPQKSIPISVRGYLPNFVNNDNLNFTTEIRNSITTSPICKSNNTEKISKGSSLEINNYDQLDELCYSHVPATNLLHQRNPASLNTDDIIINSNLSSSSPASVVTKSPLDAFAQATNDDIERAAILLVRSNTVKQLEKYQAPSKWSERLGSYPNTMSAGLMAVGEEESDEMSSSTPIRFVDRWRIQQDKETENMPGGSGINLKSIEHNTLTVPPSTLMKHRRSERAIVERMSFASNV